MPHSCHCVRLHSAGRDLSKNISVLDCFNQEPVIDLRRTSCAEGRNVSVSAVDGAGFHLPAHFINFMMWRPNAGRTLHVAHFAVCDAGSGNRQSLLSWRDMKSAEPIERRDMWVVSDDPTSHVRLADFLGSRGYGVVSCRSREELLSRLRSADRPQPSLLILDFQGSHAGGLDILTQLTREGRRLPAIILSSVGQVSIVTAAMRLGASDYLVKPFEEQELEA